jgi:DNA-directed RNA polymerase specialized sigma24 family protein
MYIVFNAGENPPSKSVAPALFATTHWSTVLAAGDASSPGAAAALERLCRAYWYPLYAHIRRRGFGPEDAQDFTQEFIANLLRRDSLASVRREKGRFRTFLLTCLNYYLADRAHHRRAAKRGAGQLAISLDGLEGEERFALETLSASRKSPPQEKHEL